MKLTDIETTGPYGRLVQAAIIMIATHDLQAGRAVDFDLVLERVCRQTQLIFGPDALDEMPERPAFPLALTSLVNRYNKEGDSNTPDFILSGYLMQCLEAYTTASRSREKWYGKELKII